MAGDGVDWGIAHFAVRGMDGKRVAQVGLLLYHAPGDEPAA